MKTRTKFLSLVFGTAIATSAIIAPSIALSSCSNGNDSSNGNGNNNQGGNGSNKPATPLPQADTSNITTFVDALQFTNKYLKENYKLENLRDDMKNFFVANGGAMELISLSKNGDQLNCVYNMFTGSNNGIDTTKPTYKIELFNLKVDYALFWDETNNKLTPYLNTTFGASVPGYFFNTEQELETKFPNYKNETWGIDKQVDSNGNTTKTFYFIVPSAISSSPQLIRNKIFTINFRNNPNEFRTSSPFWVFNIPNIFSFVNIPKAEIQDHLYQPPKPQPPQTQPQPQP